jgi:hypothetical protein
MDLKKLKNNFKFGCILLTAALFSQVQSVHAADVTVTTATTSTITATGTDTITINSGGSITTTDANQAINSKGTGVDIINRGTILSATDAIWGTNQGATVAGGGPAGVTDLIDNYGTIRSTGNVGVRLGNPKHILTTLNNQYGATIQGAEKGVYNLFDSIVTLNNSGLILGDDGRSVSSIAFDDYTNDGVGIAYITSSDSGAQTINNTSTGIISGTSQGISLSGSTDVITINNSGKIQGGVTGIMNSSFGPDMDNPDLNVESSTGGLKMVLNNSGRIEGGTYSIYNRRLGHTNTINLNKGSVIIGTIHSSTDLILNMNVGASKSYAYQTTGSGTITLNDLNNRPAISGSAYAVNIGSMEMAGENLYQNTSNIIDAIESNINTTETWVRPYYSESSRDAEGDSSAIRKLKNSKQGFTAGGAVKDSKIPLQFILNVDQSENNIDSGEHIIDSDSITLGLVAPNFNRVGSYNLSLKGLVGYSKNDTDRKILDNTSSTGERVITGDYNSINAIVGASLAKTINLDNGVKANITFGVDVVSEMRDSFNESLYFSYDKLNLVQLQPKIQSEFVKTLNNTSNAFVKLGVEVREILSGKTQDFSANNIKTSYTTPTTNDVYGTVAVGFNSKINETINLFVEANARKSGEEVETYQAIFGIKGIF